MLDKNQITDVSRKAEIRDGGDVVLKCSNCESPLLIFWITRPNAKYNWKVKANCPYCQHDSEQQEINGMFHYGPYYEITNDETMDNESGHYVETFVEDGGVINILLKRHKK